jgi:hypothetical protein
VNVKRVYRIMKAHRLLLERRTGSGEERGMMVASRSTVPIRAGAPFSKGYIRLVEANWRCTAASADPVASSMHTSSKHCGPAVLKLSVLATDRPALRAANAPAPIAQPFDIRSALRKRTGTRSLQLDANKLLDHPLI